MIPTLFAASVLYSFRLLPIFVIAPIGFFAYVPIMVRTCVSVIFGIITAVFVTTNTDIPVAITISSMASEFALGILLAISFHFVYSAVHFFAQLIDLQIGFIAGAAFDPANQQVSSPTAKLFGLILAFLFALSNMHLYYLAAFIELARSLPAASIFETQSSLYAIAGRIFSLAFSAIVPIIIAIWFVDVVTAIVSRSLPQAQVYFVGLPLKVWLGLILLAFLMRNLSDPLIDLLRYAVNSWDELVRI